MSVLYLDDNTACNRGGLAYVKEEHDLYVWNYASWPTSEPIFGTVQIPSLHGGLFPNGYNLNSYANDTAPFIPDFSGKSIRIKRYGVPQGTLNYVNFDLTYCVPSDLNTISPDLLSKITNIAYWNYGQPTGVLISPRHVIVCGHFLGSGPQAYEFSFLLKNGTMISCPCQKVLRADGSPLVSGDMHVYRLDQSLQSYVTSNLLTVYNDYFDPNDIAVETYFNINHNTAFSRAISWRICGAEKIVRGTLNLQVTSNPQYNYYYINFNNNTAELYSTNIFTNQPYNASIFVGDSGSPLFVYDKTTNKTILMGLQFGGDLTHVISANGSLNLFSLQSELATYGYSMNKLTPSNVDLVSVSDYITVVPSTINLITYINTFKNINTSPLYKYPYSSRIYSK